MDEQRNRRRRNVLIPIFGSIVLVGACVSLFFLSKTCSNKPGPGPGPGPGPVVDYYQVNFDFNQEHFVEQPECIVNQKGQDIVVEFSLLGDQSARITSIWVTIDGVPTFPVSTGNTTFTIPKEKLLESTLVVNVEINTVREYLVNIAQWEGFELLQATDVVYGSDIKVRYIKFGSEYTISWETSYIEVDGTRIYGALRDDGDAVFVDHTKIPEGKVAFSLYLVANSNNPYTHISIVKPQPFPPQTETMTAGMWFNKYQEDIKIRYELNTRFELALYDGDDRTYVEIDGTRYYYSDREDFWDLKKDETTGGKYLWINHEKITDITTPIVVHFNTKLHHLDIKVDYHEGERQYFDTDSPFEVISDFVWEDVEIKFNFVSGYKLDVTDTDHTYVMMRKPDNFDWTLIPFTFDKHDTNILIVDAEYTMDPDNEFMFYPGAMAI